MQPPGINMPARYFIPTLVEKKTGGILVFAYCPICDAVEKTGEDEHGEHRATATSVAKIRTHMRLRHRINIS